MNPKNVLTSEERALLVRYYAGISDPAERVRAEALIAISPNEQRFAQAFSKEIIDGTPGPTDSEVEGAINLWRHYQVGVAERNALRARAEHGEGERRIPPMAQGTRWTPSSERSWHRGVWGVAASLAILVVGIVLGRSGQLHRVADTPLRPVATYSTKDGQRANITLLDGTTVILNVASRLDVPADFAAGNHTVFLNGEALFTVAHHEGRPFTVVAGNTRARVLGTTFAVQHYSTDTTTTVAVQEGKVAVGGTLVSAAQFAEVTRRGITHVGMSDGTIFSFASGVLKIPAMSLARAIPELDRWYGVDIRLSDASLGSAPVKGNFVAGSVSDIAHMLEFGFDVRVVREGRVLTLYPKAK